MRVHTRAGRMGPLRGSRTAANRNRGQRRIAPMTKEELKARRRESYAEQVRKNRARGLNAHGDPFKPGYGPQRRRRRMEMHPGKTLEQVRAERREYSARLRAENYAKGLSSKGTPYKQGRPHRGLTKSDRHEKARRYGQTYYWRRRAAAGHPVPPDKQHLLMTYDNGAHPGGKLGMSATAALRLPKAPEKPAAQVAARVVMFCPCCGTNIQNVQTAVNFAE